MKCPKCGNVSTSFKSERRLDGYTECLECNYKGKHYEFHKPKKEFYKGIEDELNKDYKLMVDKKEMDIVRQEDVNLLKMSLDLGWITLCSNVKIIER